MKLYEKAQRSKRAALVMVASVDQFCDWLIDWLTDWSLIEHVSNVGLHVKLQWSQSAMQTKHNERTNTEYAH